MMSSTGPSFKQVTRNLDAFAITGDLFELSQASDGLRRLGSWTGDPPRANAEKHRARRAEILRLWLRLSQMIDTVLDPSFNPRDQALFNVPAPVEPWEDRPGLDFSDIKDPVLREVWRRAVEENDRKGAYWIFQWNLRRYDAESEEALESFLRWWFNATPEDREELDVAIRRAIWNPARVERLLRMVPR